MICQFFIACFTNLLGLSCRTDGISSLYFRTLDIHILCFSLYLLRQKRSCWKLLKNVQELCMGQNIRISTMKAYCLQPPPITSNSGFVLCHTTFRIQILLSFTWMIVSLLLWPLKHMAEHIWGLLRVEEREASAFPFSRGFSFQKAILILLLKIFSFGGL